MTTARLPFLNTALKTALPSAALLPHAVNFLLDREPWARARLTAHAGRTMELAMPPLALRLTVTAEGKVAAASEDAQPSVRIELPMSALPRTLTHLMAAEPGADDATDTTRSASLGARGIKLEGDAEFAQTISFLAQNLRWEVEDDLSRLIGDAAAHALVGSARSLAFQIRTSQQKLAGNVAEYLLEENPQLVRPRDIDELAQSLRTLRDDVARIEKRIDKLQSPIERNLP